MMTQAKRAAALGMSARMLRRYQARGCPETLKGARRWLRANVVLRDGRGQRELARLRAAQADLAELRVRERLAGLIPASDVLMVVARAEEIFGSVERLSDCAEDLARISDQALVRARLLAETRKVRLEISEAFRQMAEQLA